MNIIPEILKIIDWTGIKVRLQTSPSPAFASRKEIWWASLGQNIGVEINGKNYNFERPVLVLKIFNGQSLLICPITSTINDKEKFLIPFTYPDGEINSVNISQLRTISNRRLLRKSGEISDTDMEKILETIRERLFKHESPSRGNLGVTI